MLCRYRDENGLRRWGWLRGNELTTVDETDVMDTLVQPESSGLLALEPAQGARPAFTITGSEDRRLLSPVLPGQEVWAAGVTYESSKLARMSESEHASDLYAKVYSAERPELFFKATPSRVVGPNDAVRIRRDSAWNVPEPELTALVAATGEILGYTVGNDMSSRDIEGENALYLPQAKVYTACCALGPWVIPAALIEAASLPVALRISRAGAQVFQDETTTARMRRTVPELAQWLFRENEFPLGVLLLTGTGIVPSDTFTLQSGDQIAIEITGIGTLLTSVA